MELPARKFCGSREPVGGVQGCCFTHLSSLHIFSLFCFLLNSVQTVPPTRTPSGGLVTISLRPSGRSSDFSLTLLLLFLLFTALSPG